MSTQRITESMVVRDLVVKHPGVRELLEELGIDYCCGGKHTLKEAAAEKNVNLLTVLAGLNEALDAPVKAAGATKDWSKASLTELTDHIEAKHHSFMKAQMPRIETLLAKVVRAHSERHAAMLNGLADVFSAFKAEIGDHLAKEEMILFPAIRQMERDGSNREMIGCPIRQMEFEHDSAGLALAKMRAITSGYKLPKDACPTFAALYDGLKAVEVDLHEHIHLENNLLFPRALAPTA